MYNIVKEREGVESMKSQVFISYRRAGGDAMAYLLKEKLIASGYPTFLDIHSLDSGQFNKALYQNIDECTDVILVLSPGSLDRCTDSEDWLRLEISHALSQSKNLIPIFLEGFRWPETLPEALNSVKMYNGPTTVNFQFFQGFIDKLTSMLSCNTQKDHMPEITEKRQAQVLVWGDFDTGIVRKLIHKLDPKYKFITVADPLEITHYDLNTIHAVILLNTDVTKLSAGEETRLMLNQRLGGFVENGGLLLGTHDLIYRRTKNVLLQQAFGCTNKHFKNIERVIYHKTEECKNMNAFSSLEDCFSLSDGEVCWGDLAPDVMIYFTYNDTESGNTIPLVFSREYGDGRCFWINTGEFRDYPPQSICKVENPLVLLINEILNMEMVL
jgi:glycerophosphoryl diester phosphodiesterase